jgi:hypothetical protein
MLLTPRLRRNQLYCFRGEQLRYCRENNQTFIFTDSRHRHKQLTQSQVQLEVIEIVEFREN